MLKRQFLALGLAAATAVGLALPAVAQDCPIRGNLRMVIGSSSTGGDTYQNSAIVAQALSDKLGINVKVDATGVSEAYKALGRDSRGNTVMVFHDQAYLGYLYGIEGYANPFEGYNVGPTVAINPGNAFLVPKDSPYQTLGDIIAAAGAGTPVRVAIQPGGVSEIGFTALKNAVRVLHPGMESNIVAVNTGSQSDKDQLLFDGQADLINGSVQANEQYTRLPADDQKAMRFVWLTASEATIQQANPEGMGETTRDDLLSYVVPNVSVPMGDGTDFTFDKEFFFLFNKEMDQAIVDCIDTALADIFAAGEIQETQKTSFFIPNFRPSAEAQAYLAKKMAAYEGIIAALRP